MQTMSSKPKRTKSPDKPPRRDGAALVDALAQTAFVVMNVLTRVGAEYELSLTQMRVLGILRDRRPRMAELAEFLGLDKSTMSGLVDRSERRGLLARERNPEDARAFHVYMTAAGHALAERAHAGVTRELAPLIDRLEGEDRQILTGLLERMLAS